MSAMNGNKTTVIELIHKLEQYEPSLPGGNRL